MTAILSGALGGAWSWIMTNVFPSALGVATFWFTVCVFQPSDGAVRKFQGFPAGQRSAIALTLAVLIGMILIAMNTGLHRLLEAYPLRNLQLLWQFLIARQERRKKRIEARGAASRSGTLGSKLRDALIAEDLEDYPSDSSQLGPTRYANQLRAMETYGVTRFGLDSQTLWGELNATVPQRASEAERNARAGLDFLVNLFFVTWALVVADLAAAVAWGSWSFVIMAAICLPIIWIWKRLMHSAARAWTYTVQALVNLGRLPLADALGLVLPVEHDEETKMWASLVWAIRDQDSNAMSELQRFRVASREPNRGREI
jgi:hypothetical protein